MIEIIPNWHPIFVHFTVALITVSALAFCAGYLSKSIKLRSELLIFARWSLWLGVAITVATLIAGWIAFYTVTHDAPSHHAMTIHRGWAVGTSCVLVLMLIWSLSDYVLKGPVKLLFVIAMLLLMGLVGITAWHGAELVYRYGIGVQSLPKVSGDGHQHSQPHS